jgi:hypothetical protein
MVWLPSIKCQDLPLMRDPTAVRPSAKSTETFCPSLVIYPIPVSSYLVFNFRLHGGLVKKMADSATPEACCILCSNLKSMQTCTQCIRSRHQLKGRCLLRRYHACVMAARIIVIEPVLHFINRIPYCTYRWCFIKKLCKRTAPISFVVLHPNGNSMQTVGHGIHIYHLG